MKRASSLSSQRMHQQYETEAELLSKATAWLRPQESLGVKTLRICDMYHKGYSDLFLCVNGVFVVVELKDNTGKASLHQEVFIKDMINAGAVGGVCRSLQDIANLIERAKLQSGERG